MGNALSAREMHEEEEEKKQRERYQRLLLSLKRNQNRLFLSGEVTRVNEVTKNGRIFTARAMARAVEKLELPAFGRLEHPKCPDDASDAKAVERYRKEGCGSFNADAASSTTRMDAKTLDDMRVSHVVHDLYFNGNAVVVLVEVLECTEAGRKVREAYEKTGNLVGASMRAWGSSTEAALDVDWGGGVDKRSAGKDIRAVCEEDFELITIDLVANPSHALAYLKPHLGKLGN